MLVAVYKPTNIRRSSLGPERFPLNGRSEFVPMISARFNIIGFQQ